MRQIILIAALLIPFVAGGGMGLLRFRADRPRNIYVMCAVGLTSVLTLATVFAPPETALWVFAFAPGFDVVFRLDGLGRLFAGMIAVLWPFVTLYAFGYMKNEERKNMFFAFFTLSYGATLGVALAGNLLTIYLFYEILTLVTLPLILQPMTHASDRAARKYMYLSFGGTAFVFIGLVFLTLTAGGTGFTLGGLAGLSDDAALVRLFYVLTFMGFGVKAAVFPLHVWLPDASVAPTPVTALLHAVAVVKSGVFAAMRLTYYNVGTDLLRGSWAQTFVMIVAIVTILYGSSRALAENHFKRRLAYSTVANLSYILFGVALMTPAGFAAAMLHMVFHAVMKICSFLCAGNVLKATEREYVSELDGLGRKMPITFACFTVSGLALSGIPLFCGFVSKWNLCEAAIDSGGWLAYVGVGALLVSALLTAGYMFTVVARAYFRPPQSDDTVYVRPGVSMLLPVVVFAVLCVVFGVWAQPVVDLVQNIAAGLI